MKPKPSSLLREGGLGSATKQPCIQCCPHPQAATPPRPTETPGSGRSGGGADLARLPLVRSRLPGFLRTVQGWRGTRARGPAPLRRHSSPIPGSHLTWNPTNRSLRMLGFKVRQPLTTEMVGMRKFLLSPQWPQNNPQKLNP